MGNTRQTAEFRVTKPRREILSLLVEFSYLNTSDFYRLLPNSSTCIDSHERAVRRILRDFSQMGYVNRAPLVDFGRSERFLYYRQVYWLSSKGLELAEEEGLANGDAKANDDHSPRTLDHEHEISRFHFAVKEFCGSKQLDLYWRQHDLKKAVNPDALFAITDPLKPDGENTFYYFLEIERSKLGKYMNGEPQLLRKLVKYYEYYNSEECLGDWDDFNQFRVIVVVRTEARRRNLLTHLSDHYKHRMFWITTAELCGQDFGGPIFATPRDFRETAYSLVPSRQPEASRH